MIVNIISTTNKCILTTSLIRPDKAVAQARIQTDHQNSEQQE